MKRIALLSFTGALTLISCISGINNNNQNQPDILVERADDLPPTADTVRSPNKVQLAILFDASNSMDGLIDQAKNQVWNIVNELSASRDKDGLPMDLEIGLYQYGNDGLSMRSGYVEQLIGFTQELDEVSKALFGITTNGGSEYCGYVISSSVNELAWSNNNADLKVVFIAGNESFAQGSIPYQNAIDRARSKDVNINTIFCGNYDEGIRLFWKNGAELGQGEYLNIDQDNKMRAIDTPFDSLIVQKNSELNDTYIAYGSLGRSKKENQLLQDENAKQYGNSNVASRAISKSKKVYKNSNWDMVDALEEKEIEVEEIKEVDLPDEMKGMTLEEKEAYINQKAKDRKKIQEEIADLSKDRSEYIMEVRKNSSEDDKELLSESVIKAVKKTAAKKNITIEE